MLHQEVLDISYRYQYQLKKLYKQILGLHDISHFSLDLVNPQGEMIFFSATPSHAYEICKNGYGNYDGIISPKYYRHYEFYWWQDVKHKKYARHIESIRSGKLGLKHGFMLVRRWNNFYLIYSFATKRVSIDFQTAIINNLNHLLAMGDWAYEEIRPLYADYSGLFEPPVIEHFYPFEGGRPVARYTQNYGHIVTPKETDNIIQLPWVAK